MKLASLLLLAALIATGCDQKPPAASAPPPLPTNAAPTTAAPATGTAPLGVFYYPHAQTNLTRMKLFVGNQELDAALALTPLERQTGMMWRTNMAEGEAMLFPFPAPHRASFYMRNTYVPLSAAYIDPQGYIQEIHDFKPLNETPVSASTENIQYVLEVKQGWFQRHGISTGALVRTPYGDLNKTFSFR